MKIRILTAYVTRQFLVTFALTLLVFVFVMAIGNVFKIIDLITRGVSGRLILKVFSYGIPFSLIFAVPMSVLAAAFLVFSRMASDRELVAAKACGISLWQLLQAPVLVAALLSLVCIYLNCDLAPDSHFARRQVKNQLGVETPLSLLDEGRFVRDFPGFKIYIARRDGSSVSDIVIYEFGSNGVRQTVRAQSGSIAVRPDDPHLIDIRLFHVRIDQVDEAHPEDLSRVRHLTSAEYPVTVDMSEWMRRDRVWKKRADLRFSELLAILRGSMRFEPHEFLDPDGMARAFASAPDPLASHIRANVSETTRAVLARYDGSRAARRAFLSAVTRDLNRLLRGPLLYTPERFHGVALGERTLALLEQARTPAGADRVALNRQLLEDAYPHMVAPRADAEPDPDHAVQQRTGMMIEASTRLALSLSCYAFALLGAALGMKIHRKESSIGMAVAIGLVFVFYFFIILADALIKHPRLQPHLIVWIPIVAAEIIGAVLIRRAN